MDPLYSTTALQRVLPTLDRPTAWLRDMFFPTGVQFVTAEIAFDKVAKRRKIAPFVSPHVAGKARRARGRSVETFEPPYVKPKDEISPDENFVRLAGEAFGGELSPEERYRRNMIQKLADQDAEITRREEWMCAQVLTTGAVVCEGEDYPAQTVDFGRDPSLTKILTGGARWGEDGVSIKSNIRNWATEIAKKSGGSVTNVVFGAEAAELFTGDAEIKDVLDNRRQMDGRFQLGPVATGAEDMVAAYLGSIGQFDFWQYTQIFEAEDGTILDFFPSLGCLMAAPPTLAGSFCHGAIRDNRALKAVSRFPKMWSQEDPSVDFLMTQSAPLPVPGEVNATAFVLVR
ncbi:phage major capsid protein E [Roseibium sp. TrichSKD4]|uniref:major capsid protein n=1 Tax=Roseibium sp. TrichSKD4 TaxID=744980 RepID=UPI0001E5638B|nr:major capsid protein [Roseibium sp. TrichSKD4]EFO33909.1 phage major capsid protein E [Roseibium sp. TrichSKD4]